MAQNVVINSVTYQNVPAVTLPKTGGGTARFDDCSVVTAAASDVASGKVFVASDGTVTTGTSSGGGSNTFVVTITFNNSSYAYDVWEPDKTNAQIAQAYYDNKDIVVVADTSGYFSDTVAATGYYAEPFSEFIYTVAAYESGTEYVITQFVLDSSDTVSIRDDGLYVLPNLQSKSVTPSESAQTVTCDSGDGYNGLDEVTVGAISSTYVGSGITRRSSTDLSQSGTTVTAPAGYYQNAATLTVSGSSWTKIGSTTELTVNTTSTSAASAGTIALGSGHFTKDKIIYVRIRDKSGKRSGYFYGSDSFFMNWRDANSSTSTLSACAQEYYRCNSDGTLTGTSGAYGVYGYSLTTDGTLTIRRRYNSTNTLTINSTYLIDVYELTPPQALF